MEEQAQLVLAYGRFLMLEDMVARLTRQKAHLQKQVREAESDYTWKQLELKNREQPNFFQRLLGRAEEKKEQAYIACNEAATVLQTAQRELDRTQTELQEKQAELASLAQSATICRQSITEWTVNAATAIEAFAPAAVLAADGCLEALENAGVWMRQDARYKGVRPENSKYACLKEAENCALRLRELVRLLPGESIPMGSYLKYPDSYITGVTSEFKQLDRLNEAQDQVRACRNAVKSMM